MTTPRFFVIFGLLCSTFTLLVNSQIIVDQCNEYNFNCSLCLTTSTYNCFYDLRNNECVSKNLETNDEWCNSVLSIASAESEENEESGFDINRKRRGFDDVCNEYNRKCSVCLSTKKCFYDLRNKVCKSKSLASSDGWCNNASSDFSTKTVFRVVLFVISFLCFL